MPAGRPKGAKSGIERGGGARVKFTFSIPPAHLPMFSENDEQYIIKLDLFNTNPIYKAFYKDLKDGKTRVVDANIEITVEDLINVVKEVGATYAIIHGTDEVAKAYSLKLRENNINTIYVPHAKLGKFDDYVRSIEWAVNDPLITQVGISLTHVLSAYDVRNEFVAGYVARFMLLNYLVKRKILNMRERKQYKKLHMIESTKGWIGEVKMCQVYNFYINSWESDQAVVQGLKGVEYDDSPTGCPRTNLAPVDDKKFSHLQKIYNNIQRVKKDTR